MKWLRVLLVVAMLLGMMPAVALAQTTANSVTATLSVVGSPFYRDEIAYYEVTVENQAVVGAGPATVNVTFTAPAADGTATGTQVVLATNLPLAVGQTVKFDSTTNAGLAVSLTHLNPGVEWFFGKVDFYANYGNFTATGSKDIPAQLLPYLMLGDFVWNDVDRDGIQDVGEPGIAGITVNLWSVSGGAPLAIIATDITDSNGMYLFDELQVGEYFVQIVKPAGDWVFTAKYQGADTTKDSNANPGTGITDIINLTATNLTIDAGLYELRELMVVNKTATTTFTRTHAWDIDKKVETENEHFVDNGMTPKIWLHGDGSGNETATWTVDVTHEGYTDSAFGVTGTITVTNTGDLDAVITSVTDLVGGVNATITSGQIFPYTLIPGGVANFTYSVSLPNKTATLNTATVTTQRAAYGASAAVNWGNPTTENLATVNIRDISDLFGTVNLGSVTAPNDRQFTYTKAFAFADYTTPGPHIYNNTATILETMQSASAVLKVNWVGTELLVVNKTAATTFTRTHLWDIDKKVETEDEHFVDNGMTPKIWLYADGSGNETATWTVDVTHEGYTDSAFGVTGTITVTNTGDLDAVITSVTDLVGGVNATITSGQTFPYPLAKGATVVFTYSAALPNKTATLNTATVTTAAAKTYTGTAAVVWGNPTTENLATVNIRDISTLFGTVNLGSVTAPNDRQFTYTKAFAFADYTTPGPHIYNNTATILETMQSASAVLKVNWVGTELLVVNKTAATTFTRTHLWDIDKRVETDKDIHLEDGTPKIWLYYDGTGDETATWTVDVTYKGYTDSGFNVTGTITVTNTGDLDAVINSVTDLVGGVNATITSGQTFPYSLAKDATVVFTYTAALPNKTATLNTATVTTTKDTYTGTAAVVWGAPTTEVKNIVDIVDVSSEFGTKPLGTLNAANLAVNQMTTYTYNNHFAWADYTDSLVITNTATITQTGQQASAILKINWVERELCYEAETAWAFGNIRNNTVPGIKGSNWGWTNGPLGIGTYTRTLWAGAGQNDTSKGTDVGTVTIAYTGATVTVTYTTTDDSYLSEIHLWVGATPLPLKNTKKPAPTNAPGQFPYHAGDGEFNDTFTTWTITLDESQFETTADGEIYVAAHSVVMVAVPCEMP